MYLRAGHCPRTVDTRPGLRVPSLNEGVFSLRSFISLVAPKTSSDPPSQSIALRPRRHDALAVRKQRSIESDIVR